MAKSQGSGIGIIFVIAIMFFFLFLFVPLVKDCSNGNKTDAYKLRQAKIDQQEQLENQVHDKISHYLRMQLDDYKSYEAVDWGSLSKAEIPGCDYYMNHGYRARNVYGALVLKHQTFYLNESYNVVRVR